MQDFLIEVQTVDTNLVLFPLIARIHFAGLQNGLRLDNILRRLHRQVLLGVAIEDTEEIIITARHYRRIVAIPTALKFIKNAVILVQ